MVLFEKLFSITDINPQHSISIASYAKKYVDKICGVEPSHSDPVIRQFIYKSIRGGRVNALK